MKKLFNGVVSIVIIMCIIISTSITSYAANSISQSYDYFVDYIKQYGQTDSDGNRYTYSSKNSGSSSYECIIEYYSNYKYIIFAYLVSSSDFSSFVSMKVERGDSVFDTTFIFDYNNKQNIAKTEINPSVYSAKDKFEYSFEKLYFSDDYNISNIKNTFNNLFYTALTNWNSSLLNSCGLNMGNFGFTKLYSPQSTSGSYKPTDKVTSVCYLTKYIYEHYDTITSGFDIPFLNGDTQVSYYANPCTIYLVKEEWRAPAVRISAIDIDFNSIILYFSTNTENEMRAFVTYKENGKDYSCPARFDPNKYTFDTKLSFENDYSANINNKLNETFARLLPYIENYLNKYTQVSLGNLGFTKIYSPKTITDTVKYHTVYYDFGEKIVGNDPFIAVEGVPIKIDNWDNYFGKKVIGFTENKNGSGKIYKGGEYYYSTHDVVFYPVFEKSTNTVSAPSSFSVDTRNTTSLKVKWSAVSGASGYQLQRKKTINGKLEWVDVANTASTSYTISSLSAGTLYYLRVRTYETVNGTKQYSSWKTLTTCTKPATPSAPSVDTRATTSLKVKWNAVNKATSYEVQLKKTVNGKLEWVSLGTTKNLNYMISSLAAGTCYYIRVRAIRTLDNGNKYYSDWSKTLTTCTKPSATANFKVDSRTTTSLKLKWDAVSKATSYEVQRKKTVNGELVWVSLGTTTNKNFTISGLSAGTLYYVRVRAIRTLDNGNKYYSDWKNITTCTNPSAVKNLKVDSVQSNSVKLKWDKVSKATNYEVQQKKIVNGKATWVLLDIPSETSYNIKKLSSKTTYNFRVRAFRKLDNGNKYFSEWKEITVKTK